MRYINFNHIAKRCPKGYWKDEKSGKCVPIDEWKKLNYKSLQDKEEGQENKGRCPRGKWKDPKTGECVSPEEWKKRNYKNYKEPAPKEKKEIKPFHPKSSEISKICSLAIGNQYEETKKVSSDLNATLNDILKKPKDFNAIAKAEKNYQYLDDYLNSDKINDVNLNETLNEVGLKVNNDFDSSFESNDDKVGMLKAVRWMNDVCPNFSLACNQVIIDEKHRTWYAYMKSRYNQPCYIGINPKYLKSGEGQKTTDRDKTAEKCKNPFGEEDKIYFHFKEDVNWLQSTMAHECGHAVSYQASCMVYYRESIENNIKILTETAKTFNMEIPEKPEGDDLATLLSYYDKLAHTKIPDDNERKQRQYGSRDMSLMNFGMNPGYYANNLLDSTWEGKETIRTFQTNLIRECEEAYCYIYGIEREKLNPFDIYSGYGYYGDSDYYDTKVNRFKASDTQRNTNLTAGEKIAEAVSDVACRNTSANSMSNLILSCLIYKTNQAYCGGKESFVEFIKNNLTEEDLKSMRDNRIIKYISYAQMIAKRCPNGYHSDGKGNCVDQYGNYYNKQLIEQKKRERQSHENRKEVKPIKDKKSDDIASQSFIKVPKGSKEWKMMRQLKTGDSEEAIKSRKAVIDYFNKYGHIPRIDIEPFNINGTTFDGTKTTYTMFTDENGRYTKERQELHQKIARDLLDRLVKPTDRKPIVLFTGGGSASGKGSMNKKLADKLGIEVRMPKRKKDESDKDYQKRVNEMYDKTLERYKIDPDAIMEMIPEYEEYVKHDMIGGASVFHKEASRIAKIVYDMAIKGGYDLIYDGTFSSKKSLDMAKSVDKDRYDIHLIGKLTDVDICKKRSGKRFIFGGKDGKFPRIVPTKVLESTNEGFRKIIEDNDMGEIFDSFEVIEDSENKK